MRLDDYLTPRPDDRLVAWVDVEGATEIVLGNGPEVLSQTALVYIEVEREAKWDQQWLDVDVARYLAELGFVPIARDNQRRHQYNVIFASAELAADPEVARLTAQAYRNVRKKRLSRLRWFRDRTRSSTTEARWLRCERASLETPCRRSDDAVHPAEGVLGAAVLDVDQRLADPAW